MKLDKDDDLHRNIVISYNTLKQWFCSQRFPIRSKLKLEFEFELIT